MDYENGKILKGEVCVGGIYKLDAFSEDLCCCQLP